MSRGWGFALTALMFVAALAAAGFSVAEALAVGLCENPAPADACEAAQRREDTWTWIAGGLLASSIVSLIATVQPPGTSRAKDCPAVRSGTSRALEAAAVECRSLSGR